MNGTIRCESTNSRLRVAIAEWEQAAARLGFDPEPSCADCFAATWLIGRASFMLSPQSKIAQVEASRPVCMRARAIRAGYETGIEILRGLSVDVLEGQVAGIIGPNGAGKSTLLKAIFGLLAPWSGTLTFGGLDLMGMPMRDRVRAGICYVPQEDSLFLRMSVVDNLALAGRMATGESSAQIKGRIREVLPQFPSLSGKEGTLASLLSGGQRKLVEFGRALMTKPKLLLLDEPSAGLSPKAALEIYAHIVRLKNAGMSILLVDQNVNQALEICDHIYLVDVGQNRDEGPPAHFGSYLSKGLSAWTNTDVKQEQS